MQRNRNLFIGKMEKVNKIGCLFLGLIFISYGNTGIVASKKVDYCPFGQPLPNIFCGRGPTRQPCPYGTYCEISPVDAYAVCCPVYCEFGLPKSKGKKGNKSVVKCGKRKQRCGRKYSCSTIPNYDEKVCCPRKQRRKIKAKKD